MVKGVSCNCGTLVLTGIWPFSSISCIIAMCVTAHCPVTTLPVPTMYNTLLSVWPYTLLRFSKWWPENRCEIDHHFQHLCRVTDQAIWWIQWYLFIVGTQSGDWNMGIMISHNNTRNGRKTSNTCQHKGSAITRYPVYNKVISKQTDRQTNILFDVYNNVHRHTQWFTIQCT